MEVFNKTLLELRLAVLFTFLTRIACVLKELNARSGQPELWLVLVSSFDCAHRTCGASLMEVVSLRVMENK